MNLLRTAQRFTLATVASLSFGLVNSDTIDFKAMAEPGGLHGESIWSTFTYNGTGYQLNVTATKNGNAAYAYLDAGNAGLGVCGSPTATGLNKLNQTTNSGNNLCNPSSDDNVTIGEVLTFIFNTNVLIENIWLNNNHDVDKSLYNNTVDINGNAHTFTTNLGGPADYPTNNSYFVAANTAFTIGFHGAVEGPGDQFYVSKMLISVPVTEPETLLLMGFGLMGLVLGRRRTIAGRPVQ